MFPTEQGLSPASLGSALRWPGALSRDLAAWQDAAALRFSPRAIPRSSVASHRRVLGRRLAWSRPQLQIDRLDEGSRRRSATMAARAEAGVALVPRAARSTNCAGGSAARRGVESAVRSPRGRAARQRPPLAARARSARRDRCRYHRARRGDAGAVGPRARCPWVRGYATAEGPEAARALVPFGQALLSRHPIREAMLVELAHKQRALIASVAVGGAEIGVVALHLHRRRRARPSPTTSLRALIGHVRACPRDAWIVMSDFNACPTSMAQLAVRRRVGRELTRPGRTGLRSRAQLARRGVVATGRGGRYDRIHVAGMRPLAAELVGSDESDHFGLHATFALTVAAHELPRSLTRRRSVALRPAGRPGRAGVRRFVEVAAARAIVDVAWLERGRADHRRDRRPRAAAARSSIAASNSAPVTPRCGRGTRGSRHPCAATNRRVLPGEPSPSVFRRT